ncbi:MtrAB system histidine kinase MtrB [Solicola sp. PLA-1-18]|uniref:MtrAB system histidine kinase MtrB n=1 Tax=Solicola sp. PLA-1-18 TaxID=3380532 RepID=UPI003B7920FC
MLRSVLRLPAALLGLWRRSLQARVVLSTVLLSALVIVLVGWALLQQVADGLVEGRQTVAVAEARAGFDNAQEELDASVVSDSNGQSQVLTQLVNSLTSRSGSPRSYEVVLEGPLQADGTASPEAGVRASAEVEPSSIPDRLTREVAESPGIRWTYTSLDLLGSGSSEPAVVVGRQVQLPSTDQAYTLYYLFSMSDQQRTLDLVTRALLYAGLALVVLVGGIAFLVTRQVVTPVRLARRIAERLAAGRLEERIHVRGEDDLARLGESFNQMATSLQKQIRQLEELSRVQHRFVSDVSHELRTPLTTVRMAADVLFDAREGFDPLTARSAELLQNELDRFEALLADLLEISRFDAGAARLEVEQADLVDLAHRVVEYYGTLAERHGVTLTVVNRDGPATAEVDVRRVQRIVRNLVVNAIHYSGSERVELLVGHSDDAVALAVRDHGVGLEPGQSQLVFNRFWRADPARERTRGGTGLGLAISQEDAVLHGGWLQAWGEPGRGAQFRLTLPSRVGEDLVRSPLPLVPVQYAQVEVRR